MEDVDPPPKYSEKQESVNVLIVGETQQGKSRLIKKISDYAGIYDLNIGIGDGNQSETKTVKAYTISVAPQDYQLVDPEGHPIAEQNYGNLCALGRNDAKVVPVNTQGGDKTTFNFIDTPGLNDSHGDDLINMAHIVGKCSEISHLNALIYVRSIDGPLSKSFHQFFDYLRRCLPNFSNGFIILHTRYTTRLVNENLEQEVDLAKLRRETFDTAVNAPLEHFFLDSNPPGRSPFAQMKSLNEISRFLGHLQSQLAMPSTGFKLLKTEGMKNVDAHVQNALNELKITLSRDRQKEDSVGTLFQHNAAFHQSEISRLKVRIETVSTQVESLAQGDPVLLGKRSWSDDYTLQKTLFKGQLGLDDKEVEYVSDYHITKVTKSKTSGCQWANESLQGNIWKATLKAGTLRHLSGSATFYTESGIYNRKVIDVLINMTKDLGETISVHEQAIELNRAGEQFNANAATIGERLGKIEKLLSTVAAEEFEMSLWPVLKAYYASTKPLSHYQVREFIRVYDEDIAELLPR
jgi:hypothetical protein